MRPLISFSVLLVAVSLVIGACTGDTDVSDDTSTTAAPSDDSGESVVFGKGTMPDTVPGDFPFPAEAVIGSTLIDRNRGLTEVVTPYPANVEQIVSFFETNLAGAGFTIVSSDGSEVDWEIEFERDGLSGSVLIELAGTNVAQGVIRMTQPTG